MIQLSTIFATRSRNDFTVAMEHAQPTTQPIIEEVRETPEEVLLRQTEYVQQAKQHVSDLRHQLIEAQVIDS